MKHHEDENLSTPLTVLGMVNGMIGGLILILPVYALKAGYILTLLVILVTCIFSYYSCYLCIIHLGKETDLDYSILRHFNGARWAKVFYDLCVWLNLMLLALLYFELIIIQWQGLIPPHDFTFINPLVNAFVLLGLVFLLKYLELGANIMAYGIISIVCYALFLIWVVATYDQGDDSVKYQAFGQGAVTLAAAMGQAFSIQSFFIPVLKKNPNEKKYTVYTLIAYISGGLAYLYIGYMGSIGIWHRTYKNESGSQHTIEGYFGGGTWEVNLVEAIYLIHLYSVFPEFTLISKRRIFHVFQIEESQKGKIKMSEIIYFLFVVAVCFVVGFFKVNIDDIIDINGAVIGFLFIYMIPAVLHIKCLYFSKGKRHLHITSPDETGSQTDQPDTPNPRSEIEIMTIVRNKEAHERVIQQPLLKEPEGKKNSSEKEKEEDSKQGQKSEGGTEERSQSMAENQIDYSHFYCGVHLETYSTKALVLDWVMIVVMVGLGVFILVNGIQTVAS